MKLTPSHRCEVFGSPWRGVYFTTIESVRAYGKHWHDTYGLGLIERGAQRSASGRGEVDAYAGDLITTNPGEVHDGRPLGGTTRRWRMVYLDPEIMVGMQSRPGACAAADVQVTRPVIKDSVLCGALSRLFDRIEHWQARRCPDHVEGLACDEALVEVCGQLLDRHGTISPTRDACGDLRQVRDRLADELLDPPSLADLACMAGVSRYRLLRQFEKAYGVPPHAWLLLQRAELARACIRDGMGLAQVAASCGFSDQSHMTRIFARQFGFTPGAWQRATARGRAR